MKTHQVTVKVTVPDGATVASVREVITDALKEEPTGAQAGDWRVGHIQIRCVRPANSSVK